MLSVGQKVKINSDDYLDTKGEGVITEVFDHGAYMVASDKTLPKHFSSIVTGEYHLCFWAEELEPIE